MGLGGMQVSGRTWEWSPTWSEIMGVGGFDRGAYTGLVHGIASRLKPKPNTPSKPAAGGRPQPQLPNPQDAFTKALGPTRPTLDMQGTVCYVRSSVGLGKRSRVNLAQPPRPPVERR